MGEIVMPRLSDTMEEGTILRWLKSDGEHVGRGEELVEIETDKATMIYESDQAGLLQTLAVEGDTLAVGEVIARVAGAEEAQASRQAAGQGAGIADAGAAAPDTQASAVGASAMGAVEAPGGAAAHPIAPGSGEGGSGAARSRPASASPEGGRVRASPLARRVARESGVDLQQLTGSGPGGRIVKADVEAAGGATTASAAAAGPDGVSMAKGQTSTVELSRMQQTIARRMAESKATIPHFSIQAEVDMEECMKLREELKRALAGRRSAPVAEGSPDIEPGAAPTYNDMVVKACAIALREHPRVNGSYRDGRLQLHSRVNVGVAVAARDALVVPTVFDAEEKSLGEIARETRALAERVRAATITPPELGGGTFTVSNLGMYGVSSFTAIINPPQAAILSVGSVAPRAVVRDGELRALHSMTLTLACDHRILYGADAAEFLARVRELLEQPGALAL